MKFYRIAQDRKPYIIYKIQGGRPDEALNVVIWAVSSSQARFLAMEKYPELKSYVEGCLRRNQECDIDARIDFAKMRDIAKINRIEKEREQRKIDNAWYNKD